MPDSSASVPFPLAVPPWADPDIERCLLAQASVGDESQLCPDTSPDPQAWLFSERARYLQTGTCDPWAEHLLRRTGLLPQR